jgi:hypothetical protein
MPARGPLLSPRCASGGYRLTSGCATEFWKAAVVKHWGSAT